MLAQAELFFDKLQYTLNVVDVCVAATANALEVNLHIYQQLGKKAVIIQHSAFKKTRRGIFMCYTTYPW